MRIGLYLGRHAGNGGGMGIYSRALLESLVALMEQTEFQSDELVVYGEPSMLSRSVLERIDLGNTLSVIQEFECLGRGASYFFKRLPNGAQVRILVRVLPAFRSHVLGTIFDQIFLPLVLRRDGVDFIHGTANLGLLLSGRKKIATVHDLFQAYPVGPSLPNSLRSKVIQGIYRAFYRAQFKTLDRVITDVDAIGDEISRRYGFDRARIARITLGLDREAEHFLRERQAAPGLNELDRHWLGQYGLKPGYVLLIHSNDPRKNFELNLQAWGKLSEPERSRKLVIIAGNDKQRNLLEKRLSKASWSQEVIIIPWQERSDLLRSFYLAGVLLVASHAEGFGFPAFEAIGLGTPVVSPSLEFFKTERLPEDLTFVCQPTSEDSVHAALSRALASAALRGRWSTTKNSTERLPKVYRGFEAVAKDTVQQYRALIAGSRQAAGNTLKRRT